MPTVTQVVSKPGQFSVWRGGESEEIPVDRWINWPKDFGYPTDLVLTVNKVMANRNFDPAQEKVLCPDSSSKDAFDEAVKIATELVQNPFEFAKKFQFYQGSRRVLPYYYTHGPRTNLSFVRQITGPSPELYQLKTGRSGNALSDFIKLDTRTSNNLACRTFKLYEPKYFKKWTSNGGKVKTNKPKARKQNRR